MYGLMLWPWQLIWPILLWNNRHMRPLLWLWQPAKVLTQHITVTHSNSVRKGEGGPCTAQTLHLNDTHLDLHALINKKTAPEWYAPAGYWWGGAWCLSRAPGRWCEWDPPQQHPAFSCKACPWSARHDGWAPEHTVFVLRDQWVVLLWRSGAFKSKASSKDQYSSSCKSRDKVCSSPLYALIMEDWLKLKCLKLNLQWMVEFKAICYS